MTEPREPETKWHSPQALADRANDGFLFVVRSTGKTMGGLPSGTVKGISKVGQVLTGKKQKAVKQQTKPSDAAPSRQLDEETEPAAPQYPHPLPDVEALLKERAPQDRVKVVMLRNALDDLLHGSEAARKSALETLVGQGQVAGPLLVACSREDSPQVVEIALDGLSQIDWPCLVSCISDVLESSDTKQRIIALRAAGRLTDERKRPLLERGLRDPSARVRRRALSYLSWHDSSWAIAEIMQLCNDQQPEVKWAAVEALMTLRPSEAYDHLKLMMPSLDPRYQRRAATLLAQQEDSANKRSAARTPDQAEVQEPSTRNAPEEAKPTPPKKTVARQSAGAQSSPGRKRKRRESKKPGSDARTKGKE